MRAMNDKAYWSASLPPGSPAWQACVGTRGSLTEHLMATGHQFSVEVLAQGLADVHNDEADLLQVNAKQAVYARHVLLLLDDVPVVAARSVTREDCQVWQPILARGSRSLGLTLFGGLPGLGREALQFATLDATHPLAMLAQPHTGDGQAARRCRFTLAGSPLLVCEVFLPALEPMLK